MGFDDHKRTKERMTPKTEIVASGVDVRISRILKKVSLQKMTKEQIEKERIQSYSFTY